MAINELLCFRVLISRAMSVFGASTNGKSGDFGSPIWRFESSRPSHCDKGSEHEFKEAGKARYIYRIKESYAKGITAFYRFGSQGPC